MAVISKEVVAPISAKDREIKIYETALKMGAKPEVIKELIEKRIANEFRNRIDEALLIDLLTKTKITAEQLIRLNREDAHYGSSTGDTPIKILVNFMSRASKENIKRSYKGNASAISDELFEDVTQSVKKRYLYNVAKVWFEHLFKIGQYNIFEDLAKIIIHEELDRKIDQYTRKQERLAREKQEKELKEKAEHKDKTSSINL